MKDTHINIQPDSQVHINIVPSFGDTVRMGAGFTVGVIVIIELLILMVKFLDVIN